MERHAELAEASLPRNQPSQTGYDCMSSVAALLSVEITGVGSGGVVQTGMAHRSVRVLLFPRVQRLQGPAQLRVFKHKSLFQYFLRAHILRGQYDVAHFAHGQLQAKSG